MVNPISVLKYIVCVQQELTIDDDHWFLSNAFM